MFELSCTHPKHRTIEQHFKPVQFIEPITVRVHQTLPRAVITDVRVGEFHG